MLHILFYSNFGSLTRGGQRSLWFILRDLDKTKYRPVLLCQEEGELTQKAGAIGIPVEIFKIPRLRPAHFFKIINSIFAFNRVISRHGIEVLHSEELVVVALFRVIRIFRDIKTIWHVRVLWDTPFQKRLSLFLADRIICVSRAVADTFPVSKKVFVAQNGINIEEYVPSEDKVVSDKFNKNAVIIGYLAGLMRHKGAHVLVRSAPRVIRKYPLVKYLFIGGGKPEYIKHLKDLAVELKIADNIIFWGEETKNTQTLLNSMDIFALPSLYGEGLSRSLLEAMALEKPVVASDMPQNAEVVIPQKTGLLARNGDPEDFAEKLLFLLDNPSSAKQMGKDARRHIAEHFSLQNTMAGIYRVYDSL